jgi:hypothetical protein
LLRQVETAAPALAAEVGQFADIVVKQLTAASQSWSVKTNEAINATNADINKELFGWVVNGTDSLNDTLTVFVDKMYEGVDKFFGKTPLATPIKDVLNCLVGIKVKGIQKGLTWVHENAHITLPSLPNDTFSLGAESSIAPEAEGAASFLSDTSSQASDMITDVVIKLTNKWESMLKEEATISACIVGIWLIVVLIAIVRTLVLFLKHDEHRGEVDGVPNQSHRAPAPSNGDGGSSYAGRAATSPVFPAFDGGSPSSSGSRGVSPAEAFPNERVDPNAWLQVGTVNSKTQVEDGDYRMSVHPNIHPPAYGGKN